MAADSPIIRLAARGDGVSADGRHVPLAAPGDTLRADGSLTPGPAHAVPPCRHFPKCGGCQLQHIGDDAYHSYMAQRIVGALHAQQIDTPPIEPAHLSRPRTRRRASLRAERIGKRLLLGFNEGASHRIVDLKQCEILDPALFALVDPLRKLLPPMIADRRSAAVQMTRVDQGVDLMLEKVEIVGLEATEALIEFAKRHGIARLSVDEGYGAEARWEPEPVTVTLGGRQVAFPAGAFLQATPEGAGALTEAAMRATEGASRVVDLFAGLGTFSLSVPGVRAAVEGSRGAVMVLSQAAARAQMPIAVEHRDLFRRPLSAAELRAFDAVILDPPRSGAREQMADLAASGVPRIAYISCNPATFARDARTLIDGGYRIAWIKPVGQFRWSTHVELAAMLERVA